MTFPLRGEHTDYEFFVAIHQPIDLVVCCARIASRVPEARRGAVCELLTRINYALRIGNFEMGLRDGHHLVRHGRSGDDALAQVASCFATMSPAKRCRHPEGSRRARWLGGAPRLGRCPPRAGQHLPCRAPRGAREKPLNQSKGCGGVMRVSPIGFLAKNIDDAIEMGCAVAAVTHGHATGWIAAGALAVLVAITGNILGALLGDGAIPAEWRERVEHRGALVMLADDLLVEWREGQEWWERYPGW